VKTIVTVLLVSCLAACASTPRIYSTESPVADFSAYETYSYTAQLGTDEPGRPTTLLTQFLRSAVNRELQARGYRQVEDGGDLLVNFYVDTQEKIQQRLPDPYVGYGYYSYRRGMYVGWRGYYDGQVSQYTEGTLNIDLVDSARGVLVWEGIAIGRVTEAARRNVQGAIDEVVPQIFAEYPYRRGP
jgi:hypothetical protein